MWDIPWSPGCKDHVFDDNLQASASQSPLPSFACYLGYLSVSTDGGHSLGKKSLLPCAAEGLKQVKETHLGGLLFGVLGDPHFQV